ncbi:FxSxx-COOH system tetratricopeptide repeat protein, partial [Frankia sp. ACN1ag]|uniref:FxSxx-COOH system tetratricopeptide repeat protein n=1 Tax=Frankia sp. ACN1ag TaxID=102891 RepID=UPI001F2CA7E8
MVGAAGEVDLFVSYTAADEDWAQWVAWQCEDAGYTSCLRAWDFGPGSHVVARTHEATQRAARTVAVLSAAYLSCAFAQAQWQAVFAPDPAGRERGLVVVRVEDCAQPGLLAQMAGVDLFGVGAGEARRRLLAAIRGERGKPATAPPLPTRSFPPPAAQPTERASGAVTGAGPSFPGRLPPVWGPVPSRNLLFTGREESLAALHQRLLGDGDGDGRSVGLHGMGGVGKTQLAAEYAWRYSSGLGIVWWIDAETALGLRTGLAELARRLRVADGDLDERARAALAALGRRRDWLLIYDNVPDPHTLAALLPPATGRLLVTCRDPGMRRVGIELVEVAAFTRAETCHLLRRHLAELGDTDADRLGDAVGDLPLAVEQAGAYLAETTMPVDVYLAELAATPTVLLDEPSPHHPGLARTVSLAVDRLAATDPGAARLLHQVAFLAPEPVPLASTAEPDSGALIVGDPSTTYRTLVAISRLALAAGTTRMRLHRLVAALVRARLDDAATREAAAGALRLLATARPGDPADPSAWPAYALITPHVTAATRLLADWGDLTEPDDVRALLADTCWYLFRAGQTQTARHLATTARTRWLRRLGPDHTDSLRAAHTLAAALADLGDHKAARALDEDTLARRTRLLGADHADTLRSASQLALRLAALGDPASARALDEDTLRRRRRVLGPDHPHTLGSAANLSLRLADLGQHAAARTLDEEILA